MAHRWWPSGEVRARPSALTPPSCSASPGPRQQPARPRRRPPPLRLHLTLPTFSNPGSRLPAWFPILDGACEPRKEGPLASGTRRPHPTQSHRGCSHERDQRDTGGGSGPHTCGRRVSTAPPPTRRVPHRHRLLGEGSTGRHARPPRAPHCLRHREGVSGAAHSRSLRPFPAALGCPPLPACPPRAAHSSTVPRAPPSNSHQALGLQGGRTGGAHGPC